MKLRPRYKYTIDNMHSQQAVKKLYAKAKELSPNLHIEKAKNLLHFYIPKEERKLWTPYLAVSFEDTEEGVTVRGNIGPSEKIWLPFIFLYAGILISILFVGIYGLVQLDLGHSTTILYLLIPLTISLMGLYLFSFLGQKKSSYCILIFHELLYKTFNDSINTGKKEA